MASDLINLAAGAGVALLVGNALHHKKRAAALEDDSARARDAAVDLDARLARLSAGKARTPSGRARAEAEPRVEASPTTRAPTSAPPAPPSASARGISRAYDETFAANGSGIPVPYLRALAASESGLHIAARNGSARGLFQVVPIVLRDYRRRYPTVNYEPGDLYNAQVNTTIAADTLRTIITNYQRFHPDIPTLQEDWDSRAFVELLTFGWCAGPSEKAGVGRVVGYMARTLGVHEDVTIDSVTRWAKQAGASVNLSNQRKVSFCKAVTRRYFAERDRDDAGRVTPEGR